MIFFLLQKLKFTSVCSIPLTFFGTFSTHKPVLKQKLIIKSLVQETETKLTVFLFSSFFFLIFILGKSNEKNLTKIPRQLRICTKIRELFTWILTLGKFDYICRNITLFSWKFLGFELLFNPFQNFCEDKK